MIKLILLTALCATAMAGHAHHGGYHAVGHGHHHGHGAHSTGHHGHHGHGWRRPYHGWASVNVWQEPHAFQFGFQEQGKGYNKVHWQGADFHHSHPVKHHGHGHHGHGHAY